MRPSFFFAPLFFATALAGFFDGCCAVFFDAFFAVFAVLAFLAFLAIVTPAVDNHVYAILGVGA
jgi:hypothetical protein